MKSKKNRHSVALPVSWTQHTIFLSVNTDIPHDGNETAVVFLRSTDARTEDLQQVTTENTSGRDGSVDLSSGGEGLVSRDGRGHADLAFQTLGAAGATSRRSVCHGAGGARALWGATAGTCRWVELQLLDLAALGHFCSGSDAGVDVAARSCSAGVVGAHTFLASLD